VSQEEHRREAEKERDGGRREDEGRAIREQTTQHHIHVCVSREGDKMKVMPRYLTHLLPQ
jgi:type IV secretory pathway VirD2 relaxase